VNEDPDHIRLSVPPRPTSHQQHTGLKTLLGHQAESLQRRESIHPRRTRSPPIRNHQPHTPTTITHPPAQAPHQPTTNQPTAQTPIPPQNPCARSNRHATKTCANTTPTPTPAATPTQSSPPSARPPLSANSPAHPEKSGQRSKWKGSARGASLLELVRLEGRVEEAVGGMGVGGRGVGRGLRGERLEVDGGDVWDWAASTGAGK